MKVLYIGHETLLNGASKCLIEMVNNLPNDIQAFILLPAWKEDHLSKELLSNNKVTIFKKKYYYWMEPKNPMRIAWLYQRFLFLLKNLINYLTALQMIFIIRKEKVDLIHSNSSVINIGAILSKFTGIPHIWHFREFGQEDFNMFPLIRKKAFIHLINQYSDHIITVSNAVYKKYISYIKDADKVTTIYDGVDLCNKQKKTSYFEDNNLNILIAGRLSEGKGQATAILAINELYQRGYRNITLYLAGAGNLEILSQNNIFNKDRIKLLGYIKEIHKLRRRMDLELVCSRAEAYGRVTIEAMMSSLPVIGADTGGTKELIIDGYNGFLFKQGDFIDLADKIQILLDNKSLFKTLGENTYKYASSKFKIQQGMDQIIKIYSKILTKNNSCEFVEKNFLA